MSGIAVAIAIPLVIKALIDGPIEDHDASGILPLGLLVLGLGILEAFLIWWRRWVQNKAVLEVETEMRHDLYERLQELPMSFHSQWQSGQLLSRATTDLSAIRRFFGFGMLFLVVNITQVVVTTARAAPHVLAARPGRRRDGRPDRVALDALREGLRRRLAPTCRTSRATSPRWPRRARSASG